MSELMCASSKAPDHIYAKMIEDTINPDTGVRISSIQICLPRMILAEFNTHKVIIKNFSSSRAIPSKVLREQVWHTPFTPVYWGTNQKGMSAAEELKGYKKILAVLTWRLASKLAVGVHYLLEKVGVHKQTCNRVLEPFLTVTGLATATEWQNFLKLRLSENAQPEIQELAKCIKFVLDNSTPRKATDAEPFHFPYLTEEDKHTVPLSDWYKISTARCCRASYNKLGATSGVEADIALSNRLIEDEHYSPFEQLAIKVPTDLNERARFFVRLDGWKDNLPILNSLPSEFVKCIYLQRNFVGVHRVAVEASGWIMLRAVIDPFAAGDMSKEDIAELKQALLFDLFQYFKKND